MKDKNQAKDIQQVETDQISKLKIHLFQLIIFSGMSEIRSKEYMHVIALKKL